MNKKMIFFLLLIFVIFIAVVLLILIKLKVDITYHSKIRVDKIDSTKIFLSTNDAYKLKVGDTINFLFNSSLKSSTIKIIAFDTEANSYYAEILPHNFSLIVGSNAEVVINGGCRTLLQEIIASV